MKLARLPSWDWRFEAANCDLMMTPIGFCRPVTKAMMKNRANITAMGGAAPVVVSLPCRNGFTRPAACSGRCVGSVSGRCSEGRFFLRFRNGPERNGGFSGRRKEAFRFPPSRRSGLSVRFVPFRRTGGIFCAVPARRRHYLRFSRRVRSRRGFRARKLQYRGYCLTLFTSPPVPARWYCFRSVGENGMQSMVYMAVL